MHIVAQCSESAEAATRINDPAVGIDLPFALVGRAISQTGGGPFKRPAIGARQELSVGKAFGCGSRSRERSYCREFEGLSDKPPGESPSMRQNSNREGK